MTIDLETAEAEKAAIETRISMLKRERQRLEAELTRAYALLAEKAGRDSYRDQDQHAQA